MAAEEYEGRIGSVRATKSVEISDGVRGLLDRVAAAGDVAKSMSPEVAREVLAKVEGVTVEQRVAANIALGATGSGLGALALLVNDGKFPVPAISLGRQDEE